MTDSGVSQVYRDFWERFEKKIAQRPSTPLYFDLDELESNYLPQKRNLPDGINYTFASNLNQGYLQVKFHIHESRDDRDEIYHHLKEHRDEVESAIGERLDWSRKDSYDTITLQRDGNIKTNPEEWDEYLDWLIEYGERFDEVFRPYLQQYRD